MRREKAGWVRGTLKTHFGGETLFTGPYFGYDFPGVYAPIFDTVAILLVLWLVCLWMYRQKIFIRI